MCEPALRVAVSKRLLVPIWQSEDMAGFVWAYVGIKMELSLSTEVSENLQ
jgi:hypothetical protein